MLIEHTYNHLEKIYRQIYYIQFINVCICIYCLNLQAGEGEWKTVKVPGEGTEATSEVVDFTILSFLIEYMSKY